MTAAAILCGGESSRLGVHKALVLLDGVPAILQLHTRLHAAGLHPIFAVTGPGGPSASELGSLGLTHVLDDAALRPAGARGPLCGVVAALRAAGDTVVCCPVDHPFIPSALLARLAARAPCALPDNPLCAALPPNVLPQAEALLARGHTGVRRLLREQHVTTLGRGALWMADPAGARNLGFNTPEQLRRLQQSLHGGGPSGAADAPVVFRPVRPGQQAPQQ